MEETGHGRCSVVYYCPGCDHDISEVFRPSHPPAATSDAGQLTPSLDRIYSNVRRLIDENQGDFDRVFVSSRADACLKTLELFAKTAPAAVLVEFGDATVHEKRDGAFDFLRALSTDPGRPRHSHHVMPFVLLATTFMSDADHFPDSALETSYLSAGAIDTMRSPLCSEAINQLVGHVKEICKSSAHALGAGMANDLVRSIGIRSKPEIASHRPDEILSAQRRSTVEDAVAKWQFPAHDLDMDELTYGALVMLELVLQNAELEPYRLSRPELMTFLLATRREYKHEREVHYHNWRHAVDVTQSIYHFLGNVRLCPLPAAATRKGREVSALERILSPLDALILIVSAIGHDVGHPGVNNAFLVASHHELAHVYNDKSVLENYHCAAYSQLLRRHWPSLSTIPRFRDNMISTILATDMQRHFEYMGYLSDLKQKVENSSSDLGDWSDKDRAHARDLMMALLIKAADISNIARPFDISAQWALILMNEFARQGELEHELQIPTCLFGGPPNKEDVLAAAQSQKGFMNLFGFPLFRGISEVMPNISCTISVLETNKEVWEQRITDEKSRREAVGDGRASPRTYGSVTETQVREARMRKRESEPAAVPVPVPQTPTLPAKRQPDIDAGGSPVRHPATDLRNHKQLGIPLHAPGEKRASTPPVWPSSVPLSPTGASSRRSSKDVALNQLHELSTRAQQNLAPTPDSRRGSTDAGWQVHSNCPGSRRGSKDESLTTILVTSPGSPASRGSAPASPKANKPKQGSGATRFSIPSSRSQATSSGTATTSDLQAPSTQPSSIAPTDEDSSTPTAQQAASISATDGDPFMHTSDWPADVDGAHHSSALAALPSTPPESTMAHKSTDSPQIIARMASGDSAASRSESRRRSETQVRQSRSRSRLRSLKFWKKRRDVSVVETPSPETTPP